MRECCSTLPSISPTSYFPAMCCGAAHLWTLLNGALVWPDSSPLLHFPSNLPAQPSGCHRKAVKTFHSFCMAALFPSALNNNSNILSHNTLHVSLVPSTFFTPSAIYSLTGYFHPRVTCQSLVSSAPGIICFVFVSICWMTARAPLCHQLHSNYFLLTNSIFTSALHWLH